MLFCWKRKYPTVANVEKKKEEETKRQASGQVLKTKNFRYLNITFLLVFFLEKELDCFTVGTAFTNRLMKHRYRKGQHGGRTFHRGGLTHFNKTPHQRRQQDFKNKIENGSQISEKVQDKGNEESQCQETKVLQNGEDPLSIVLGDCDGAESGNHSNYY